jgi:hypothetical protein
MPAPPPAREPVSANGNGGLRKYECDGYDFLVGLGVPNFKPAGDEKAKKAALPSPPVSTARTLLSENTARIREEARPSVIRAGGFAV